MRPPSTGCGGSRACFLARLPPASTGRRRWLRAATASAEDDVHGGAGKLALRKLIRVERPTHLPLSQGEAWRLMQELAGNKSMDATRVLKGIEFLYRSEFLLLGEDLSSAFDETNDAGVKPGQRRGPRNQVRDTVHALRRRLVSNGSAKEAANGCASVQPQSLGNRVVPEQDEWDENGIKAAPTELCDQLFLDRLLEILAKAHFVPLSVRDVALSRSLNVQYYSKLFIKGKSKHLDGHLTSDIMGRDLPAEMKGLLVFRRGYGSEEQRGRFILTKLDYLQQKLVASVSELLTSAAKAGCLFLMEQLQNAGEGSLKTLGDEKSVVQERGALERQDSIDTDVRVALNEWGIPPRVSSLGYGLLATLAEWGVIPRADTVDVDNFNNVWPAEDASPSNPAHIERVSFQDAYEDLSREHSQPFLKKVEMVEPTFSRTVVVYRRVNRETQAQRIRNVLGIGDPDEEPKKRNPIMVKVYADIPVPIWKVVFPDKILQFRPLDALRLDLINLIGLSAFIAQANFDSPLLDIASLGYLVIFFIRAFRGYRSMSNRYESFVNDLLSKKTVAGQQGALVYLTLSAASQQFKQSGLAYALLCASPSPLDKDALCSLLETKLGRWVSVRFDGEEALRELKRLRLLVPSGAGPSGAQQYRVVDPGKATAIIRGNWDRLLQDSSLKMAAPEDTT